MKPKRKNTNVKPAITVDEFSITLNWGKTNPENYCSSRLYIFKKDGLRQLIYPMPNTLQEQINEVMEQFDENFTEVEFLHGVPVDLPREYKQWLKAFITQHLKTACALTYERIRPEKVFFNASEYLKGYTEGNENTIKDFDANWNAWKGEV